MIELFEKKKLKWKEIFYDFTFGESFFRFTLILWCQDKLIFYIKVGECFSARNCHLVISFTGENLLLNL